MLEYIRKEWAIFIVAICTPIVPMLFFIGMLIVADTLTSFWASKKKNKPIVSARMFDCLVPKLILYPSGILLASAFEYLYPEIPAIKVTSFMFISVEAKSLGENFTIILGMPFVKWLKLLIFKGKKVYADELFSENQTPKTKR